MILPSLDEKGVSLVLGAIILITIGVMAFYTFYPVLVQSTIRGREADLMTGVGSSFLSLKDKVVVLAGGGSGGSVSFPMSPAPVPFYPAPKNASGLTVDRDWLRENFQSLLAVDETFPNCEKWEFVVAVQDNEGGPENGWSGEGDGSAFISSERGESLVGGGYWRTVIENLYFWSPSEVEIKFHYMAKWLDYYWQRLTLYLDLEYRDPNNFQAVKEVKTLSEEEVVVDRQWLKLETGNKASYFTGNGIYGIRLRISYKTGTGSSKVFVYFDNVKVTVRRISPFIIRYGAITHQAPNMILPPQTHIYEVGAIIRAQDNSNVMLYDPGLFLQITGPVDGAYAISHHLFTVAGPADHTSRLDQASIEVTAETRYEPGWLTERSSVEIQINSNYQEAWRSYLSRLEKVIDGMSGLSAKVDPQELKITITAQTTEGFRIFYGIRVVRFDAPIT